MCESCGCGDAEVVALDLQREILAGNARMAERNARSWAAAGVTAINLMGSPGSGKTALLEATAQALGGRWRLGAVSGDLATERDAERLRAAGIVSAAITTGSACHLDAELVHRALHTLPWKELDILFIENVGNLVCPAVYALGETAAVVALSVTEGEDKPLKYPVIFRRAELVVLTKVDLLPHLPEVRVEAIRDNLARVMPEASLLPLSARSGEGIAGWIDWLEARRDRDAARGEAQAS